MEGAAVVLAVVEAVELVLLALVAVRRWWRIRDRTHAWLATTFGLLAAIVCAGPALPKDPHGFGETLAVKLAIVAIVLFPYCLYRFTRTFLPARVGLDRLGAALTLAVVAWTLALPRILPAGHRRTTDYALYVAVLLVQWTVLSGAVAWLVWRAGRRQPTVARRRMRMLSVAAGGLAVLLLMSGVANAAAGSWQQITTQVAGVVIFPLFLVGFAPPRWLIVLWRQREQQQFGAAITRLMSAATVQDIAGSLLPSITEFVGGTAAALIGRDGTVLGTYRLDAAAAADLPRRAAGRAPATDVVVAGDELWVPLSAGWLVIRAASFMPFFGADEARMLMSTGSLADVALSRAALLQRDREHVEVMRHFVAVASHDLRTPVTAINGFARLLGERWPQLDDADKVRMVESIGRQSAHLSRLVEDLLTASQLDAAAVSAQLTVLDVRREVELLVHDIDIPAAVDLPVKLRVLADRAHLRRMLTNYLRNAAHHGAPPFRVGGERRGAEVDIWVSDAGPGVPPEFVPRLFERYARAQRGPQSTGLGLSIVRGLAEAGGGSAWYRNTSPHGACFGLTLPAPLPEQQTREIPWTNVESSSSSRMRRTSAG